MSPSLTSAIASSDLKYASGDPTLAIPEDGPKGPPTFKDKYEEREYLKQRMAMGFRVLAHFGFCEGVAGHITLKDPVDPDCFWVNPFGAAVLCPLCVTFLLTVSFRSSFQVHQEGRSDPC